MSYTEEIKSVNLETPLKLNLRLQKQMLQQEFFNEEEKETQRIDEQDILGMANSGEIETAKRILIEKGGRNDDEELVLELLAILETYKSDISQKGYWNHVLSSRFPKNSIGRTIDGIKKSIAIKDWDSAEQACELIIGRDRGSFFANSIMARSNAAKGKWELSLEYWKKAKKSRKLNEEESFQAARSAYNCRMFQDVIDILFEERNHTFGSVKSGELIVRSYYNLMMNEMTIDSARRLLDIEPKNTIGLRHYARSLIRLGKLSEAIPIIETMRGNDPFSVETIESLIEVKLMMDKVEDANAIWEDFRKEIKRDVEGFFAALEIALRFNWRDVYLDLIAKEGREHENSSNFAEKIAQINLEVGDIGMAYKVLSEYKIELNKSAVGKRILEITDELNLNLSEINSMHESNGSVWITELVVRDILRNVGSRSKIRKGRKKCHLISSSIDRGGAERQVSITLKQLAKSREYECSLAVHRLRSTGKSGTYEEELREMRDSIIDMSRIQESDRNAIGNQIINDSNKLLGFLDPGVRKKVEELIIHFSKYRPDIVHAWQDETILTSCIAAALTKIPVIIGSARSLGPEEKTILHLRKRPYIKNCFKEIFSWDCHYLSTNSEAGKRSYANWIGMEEDNISVSENGVDFQGIESKMNLTIVKEKIHDFGFGEANKIIGGLFRLEAGKRPELWIEAFEEARKEDPSLRGIIIGGGRMEEAVNNWVKEANLDDFIKVVGQVEDVGSWLSVMDIFLFTSVAEGLPNVLIEAQGFGIPVVSTNVGGVPEIVIDGETGKIVNDATGLSLGDGIIELLNREDLDDISSLSRKSARERFSVTNMAVRTSEMYSCAIQLQQNSS